ncbi:ABC transporter permease subunit [Ferrimonas balearica]|uniref:ABC transporter permease subunit n=1 Tax=Ferrimonas balearica TaxID=44012 RepID=UPI001F354CC9|nr:ABC transporter permease subunit [Ferrimonas balearica]MBY6017278.1 ABC transporter permease subunit [Halomonas denitrificans]MBY6093554.1 ABC transporter permease subunit [Ferrimonas balearica]
MASPQLYHEDKIPSPWHLIWQHFANRPTAMLGLWCLTLVVLISVFGPLLAPYDAEFQAADALLKPPSWHAEGSVEYFLGTDDLGRDIFSRLLHGAHLTFGYAALIVLVALAAGFVIGAFSGMSEGLKSSVLGHLLDALLSLPSVVLALLIAAVLGPGLDNVFWAVGLALLPGFIRAVHNAVHDEMQKEYVMAARLDGANRWQQFRYVILPNVTDAIVVQTTLAFSNAILDIAALGFLALGAQAPSAEWGAMVNQGLDNVLSAPWTVTMPGLAILLSVLATNLVGDGLRQAIAEERG